MQPLNKINNREEINQINSITSGPNNLVHHCKGEIKMGKPLFLVQKLVLKFFYWKN